jgi:hypothetical protein
MDVAGGGELGAGWLGGCIPRLGLAGGVNVTGTGGGAVLAREDRTQEDSEWERGETVLVTRWQLRRNDRKT